MKIRHSFVSNSSSTSYIIAVTRDFKPTEEQINKYCEEFSDWWDGEHQKGCSPEEAVQYIQKIIETLCVERCVWTEPEDKNEEKLRGLDTFLDVFPELEIASVTVSSEAGECTNVLSDRGKEKWLAKMDKIMEMAKNEV